MTPTLYVVPVETMFEPLLYTVLAISKNDARLKAITFFENQFGLSPAKWEAGNCGNWVRTTLLHPNPDASCDELDDGYRAMILEPQPLAII